MKRSRTYSLFLLLALVTLVVALASGCGGGDSSADGVAAIDTGGPSSAGTSGNAAATKKDPKEAAYEWAKCMRKEGVAVDDPDGRGMLTISPNSSRAFEAEDFEEARKKCGDPAELGMLPEPTEAETKEMQEGLLAFAKCMRERGIEMPDPEFTDGRGSVQLPEGNLNSPKFQDAQEACGEHTRFGQTEGKTG